jgi:hypothetical protein
MRRLRIEFALLRVLMLIVNIYIWLMTAILLTVAYSFARPSGRGQ